MMRIAWFTVLFLGFFYFSAFAENSLGEKSLKIVTWNLEWFPGRVPEPTPEQEQAHLAAVQAALRELDPDIFIALEVRDWAAFQEAIQGVPGLRVHVVSSFRNGETGEISSQQICIASKLKCRAAWAEEFTQTIPTMTRGFAFAALVNPEKEKLIMVYGVHLKSNRARYEKETRLNYLLRDESAEQLLQHISTMGRLTFKSQSIDGWVVAGDFNTNHDKQFGDKVIEKFTSKGFTNTWGKVPQEKRQTWRGNPKFAGTTFDYILVRGLGLPTAFLGQASSECSDHEAVVVQIPLQR